MDVVTLPSPIVPKRVVVVGGGIAGLAAAVYLARAGHGVTVFEKRRVLGGRAVTHLRHGYRFNLGPHAVYRAGAASRIYRELGVPVRGGTPKARGLALLGGDMRMLPASPLSILMSTLLTLTAKAEALTLFARIGLRKSGVTESMTIREWLDRSVHDPELRSVMETFIRVSTYSGDPGQSASVAVEQLRIARKGVIYVDEGWQKLVDTLHSHAVAVGVTFVTTSRIVGLNFDDRMRAVELGGFELEDGTDTLSVALPEIRPDIGHGTQLAAETVILAVDPVTAADLAGDAPFTQTWRSLKPVTLASLDVALSRLPVPRRTLALGIDEPLYYSVHSAHAQLTPKGGALIHAAIYGGSKDAEVRLERLLDQLQPGWRDVLVHRRFLPSLTVSNALVTPGMKRPAATTPIRGLYVAGDWVGDEGLLSDAALASARVAAQAIMAEA